MPLAAADHAKHARLIKRSADRMSRLVEDLLEVAKIEAGRLSLEAEPLEVGTLLEETREAFQLLAEERGIRLETAVQGSLERVSADRGRVIQALSNLVGNAFELTPDGGSVTLRAAAAEGGVSVSVTDTGVGIPRESLPHFFERFWQGRDVDRRGAGLGLAIVKGIVEAHGGAVTVQSEPGRGSTFGFTLRSAAPGPRETAPGEARPAGSDATREPE